MDRILQAAAQVHNECMWLDVVYAMTTATEICGWRVQEATNFQTLPTEEEVANAWDLMEEALRIAR